MAIDPTAQRLLAGPSPDGGAERLEAHVARLGALPLADVGRDLLTTLERSGLLGRGGAGYAVARKWRALAERRGGQAVVVANGAEGEPASFKDRILMARRPHLVLDGALLAAAAVGADELVLYVGTEHEAATATMRLALAERRAEIRIPARVVTAPVGYVAGEATAAVHYINRGDARPTTSPPRMSEHGVSGRPTLVQNVETLAHVALIVRYGDDWYRSVGRYATRGTGLVTISGAVRTPGVREIELGTTVGELATEAGGDVDATGAVLLGGYFGTWAHPHEVRDLPLDPLRMSAAGLTFGCGLVRLLPRHECGVAATAEIMRFMAGESAGQCGPCLFGLRALGEAVTRLADGHARADDLDRIELLVSQTAGRGACHHPDGAVQLLASAMRVFGHEVRHHARTGRCSVVAPAEAVA